MKKRIIVLIVTLSILGASIVISQGQLQESITKDSVFIELLKNDADLTEGYAEFKFYCPLETCDIKDLSLRIIEEVGTINSSRIGIERTKPVTKNIYGYVYDPNICSSMNGSYDCGEYKYSKIGTAQVQQKYWDWNKPIVTKGEYKIRIEAQWEATIGFRSADWIPKMELKKFKYPSLDKDYSLEKTEWAWWNNSWSYYQAINITNNNDTIAIPINYTYNLTVDTASMISSGYLRSDCADLRVVYMNNTVLGWNLTDCDSTYSYLKFKIQSGSDVSAGSYNDTAYLLFFGSPSETRPDYHMEDIFYVFDDFEDGDVSDWMLSGTIGACSLGNNGLLCADTNSGSSGGAIGYANISIGVVISAEILFNMTSAGGWESGGGLIFTYFNETHEKYHYRGTPIQAQDYRFIINAEGNENYTDFSDTIAQNTWYYHKLKVMPDRDMFSKIWTTSEPGDWDHSELDYSTLGIPFSAGMAGVYKTTAKSYWDNFTVELLIDPEPTATLGPLQSEALVINITSPENKTYASNTIDINVTASANASSCVLSIDGSANVSMFSSTPGSNQTYTVSPQYNDELLGLQWGVVSDSYNYDYEHCEIGRYAGFNPLTYERDYLALNTTNFSMGINQAEMRIKIADDDAAMEDNFLVYVYTNSSFNQPDSYCDTNEQTCWDIMNRTTQLITTINFSKYSEGDTIDFDITDELNADFYDGNMAIFFLTNKEDTTNTTSVEYIATDADGYDPRIIYNLPGPSEDWYYELSPVSDGTYQLDVYCVGAVNDDSQTVHFTVDTTSPEIQVTSPTNTTYTDPTVNLNVAANETIDTWWYSLNGGSNATFSPNTTISIASGINSLIVYANDSVGNENSHGPIYFTLFNYSISLSEYESDVLELSSQAYSVSINFSDVSSVSSFSGTFNYNGTSYAATAVPGGDGYELSRTITVPNVEGYEIEIPFFWNFSFDYALGTESNVSENETQTVYSPAFTNCSGTPATSEEALILYLLGEDTDTPITGELELVIELLDYGSNYSWNMSGQNNYTVCIYPAVAELEVDSFMQYTSTNWTTRNYYLDNAILTNDTQEINLYLQNESGSTQVSFSVLDYIGQSEEDVVISIQKHYIGDNVYKTVAMSKTDFQGAGYSYLELPNNWYRFILSRNGEILQTYSAMQLVDTSVTFRLSSTAAGEWFDYYDNVGYSCTTSDVTNSTTCTVIDSSGLMANASLRVYKDSAGIGWLKICDDYSTSSSSTLTCSLGNTSGQLYYYVLYLTFPDTYYTLDAEYLDYRSSQQYGTMGIAVALMLLIVMSMIGAYRPSIAVALSIVSVVLSYWGGFADIGYGAILALAISAGIGIYKMRSG